MCLKSVYAAAAHIFTKCAGRPCLKVKIVLAFRSQVAFSFHVSVTSFTMQDPISSVPSSLFSDVSPLILFYYFTPAVVGSWVFLRPTRPASAFQPRVGFVFSTCIAPSWIFLTHSLTSFKILLKCYLNITQPTLATF